MIEFHQDNNEFQGQIDMTNKFFGVINEEAIDNIEHLLSEGVVVEDGVIEISLPVRIIASERQNRLLVLPIS